METRIAMIGIIVENPEAVASLNAILHDYGGYVVGRMGIPYPKRGVNLISLAVDAPQDTIAALSGKIGRLPGVSAKTAYSGKVFCEEDPDDRSVAEVPNIMPNSTKETV